MRTIVDLPQDQAEAVERLSQDERRACETIIQAAVADYLNDRDRFSEEGRAARRAAMMAAFGIWKGRGIDGLEYQRRMRAEWDGRARAWGDAEASVDDACGQVNQTRPDEGR